MRVTLNCLARKSSFAKRSKLFAVIETAWRIRGKCCKREFRMSESNQLRVVFLLSLLFLCARLIDAQQMPSAASSPNASPSPTPIVFSPQTLTELKRLQQAALNSDYAYRQVAHLANNIGPRLTGSAQAAKAVDYVASELKAIGCEVQLEKVMVPHWVRGEETAALVQFPGQAPNTTQKI